MAAVDMFLKIEGVDGESKQKGHEKSIEIESWSIGESQIGTHGGGGGGGAGKVSFQDFHFTMKINSASPKLFLHCATGEHIKKATLTCRKAGGKQETYLEFTMSDLLVSSYQTGGHGEGSILPTDSISINFTKIEMDYKVQDEKGGTKTVGKVGYDIKAGQKV